MTFTAPTPASEGVRRVSCSVCGVLCQETVIPAGVPISEQYFPDETFRSYLLNGFDKDGDGCLSNTDLASVEVIDINGRNVASLEGISYFTALKTLNCSGTQLTSLNVSKNTTLEELDCSETKIASLDVSHNPNLVFLGCSDTQLTSLDVSKNTVLEQLDCGNTLIKSLDVSKNAALKYLYCYGTGISALNVSKNTALEALYCSHTGISSLNVSKNTALKELDCGSTQLTSLDVSHNGALQVLYCHSTKLETLDVSGNPELTALYCNSCRLTCLDLSNNGKLVNLYAGENEYDISGATPFTMSAISGFDKGKVSNVTNAVYDAARGEFGSFTGKVSYIYDCGNGHKVTFTLVPDSILTVPDGVEINDINFPDDVFREYVAENFDSDGDGSLSDAEIETIKEIRFSLTKCSSLQGIEYFTALQYLDCSNTQISELDVSRNTALQCLYCSNTEISELDISKNTSLQYLDCSDTQISTLDVSHNTVLQSLACCYTQIRALDMRQNSALWYLNCSKTQISMLDVSQNTALKYLYCSNLGIDTLEISHNSVLQELDCCSTQISELDVSSNSTLECLSCDHGNLAYIDVTRNNNLSTFSADGNYYLIPADFIFDVAVIPGFDKSKVSDVTGADYNPTTGIFTNITGDIGYTYDCGNGHSEVFTLQLDGEPVIFENVEINNENFPDDNFRYYVSLLDLDEDGYLSAEEIASATELNAYGDIASFKGLEYLTELRFFGCGYNTLATELDVSNNKKLQILYCDHAMVDKLDVSNNKDLQELWCPVSNLSELNVNGLTELKNLSCYETKLSELDVSSCTALEVLECYDTQISKLDVSQNTELWELSCDDCLLTFIDLSHNTKMEILNAGYNYPRIPNAFTFDAVTVLGINDPSRISNVEGADYDPSTGIFTNVAKTIRYTYDCGNGFSANFWLELEGVPVSSGAFPDSIFREYVASNFDLDGDGFISESERAAVQTIHVDDSGIGSLKGIEYFEHLRYLSCANNPIRELDVSRNQHLENLYCYSCNLAYIDLSYLQISDPYVYIAGNYYVIPAGSSFDTAAISGFNKSRVSNVTGADYDASTGIFTNITGNVSYTYDCGNGHSETFTLRSVSTASGNSTVSSGSGNTADFTMETGQTDINQMFAVSDLLMIAVCANVLFRILIKSIKRSER